MVSFGKLTDYLLDYLSLNPMQLGSVKSDEFLRYFQGGWQGVKRRFGDAFRKRIKRTSTEDLSKICLICRVHPSVIYEIARGDYRRMDSDVVNMLSNVFLYDSAEGLGELTIPDNERLGLLEKMAKSGFCAVSGTKVQDGKLVHADPSELSQDNLLSMYIVLSALEEI